MNFLAQVVVWLNAIPNRLGSWLLAPLGFLPGWLSNTLAAAVSGVVLLIIFKYTSPQRALKRVKDANKAHLLSLKLFKDSAAVALSAQGGLLIGAGRLAILALPSMLVMVIPVLLILGQLALWYQARPLRVGEEAVITLKLTGQGEPFMPPMQLLPTPSLEAIDRPVRIFSQREACWNVKARQAGSYRLQFQVGDQLCEKELAIGDGFMRVSVKRPGWDWFDALMNPWEEPFGPDSAVYSIEIDYPQRDSWTSGTDWWVLYWFGASMVFGFCFRGPLNVNI